MILIKEMLQLRYGVLTQVSSAFGFKEMRLFLDVRMYVVTTLSAKMLLDEFIQVASSL